MIKSEKAFLERWKDGKTGKAGNLPEISVTFFDLLLWLTFFEDLKRMLPKKRCKSSSKIVSYSGYGLYRDLLIELQKFCL